MYFIKRTFQINVNNILIAIIDVFQCVLLLREGSFQVENRGSPLRKLIRIGWLLLANCLLKPSIHYAWDSE
ncbi:hypothetical protein V8V91_14640 [Algoriphagus halophilus]|uniref:hypothetical protein n=1 Tax=Algoriphagus halophilus TaxID=226505 RepID=UPI00358E64F3